MTTIRDVAKAAGVSTATVSAVVNGSAYVSPELRGRVLVAVEDLKYTPMSAARNLKRGRSQLIALVVSDLANPFFGRIVWAAEAAVAAWGYALLVFNSDEKPENEKQILSRVRTLSCDGVVLVPVGTSLRCEQRDFGGRTMPLVMFGRTISDCPCDSVRLDNISAARQVTNYLLDLGHRRIGTITGPQHLSTGRGRLDGMLEAMEAGSRPRSHPCALGRIPRGCRLFCRARNAGSRRPSVRLVCGQWRHGARRHARTRRSRAEVP